jgi:sugar phosphate isomerase/epimerase
MPRNFTRRQLFRQTRNALFGAAGLSAAGDQPGRADDHEPLFEISLAQWSLNRQLFDGELDNLDFARLARQKLNIDAIEYVNQFFKDKARDKSYLKQMNERAADNGVTNLLIMCDGEGRLGAPNKQARRQAVENHHKWVDAASFLGCHAIRVNAASEGSYQEQKRLVADGLHRLCEYADGHDLSVLVENHGGLSSNGQWLAEVMREVDHPRVGTLPDFGNFGDYDNYKGVKEMMPFARAVSAKSHAFDENGRASTIDYERMMRIVLEAGYRGHVGIEYEGDDPGAYEGIRLTRELLLRLRDKLADEFAA